MYNNNNNIDRFPYKGFLAKDVWVNNVDFIIKENQNDSRINNIQIRINNASNIY